MQRSGKRSRKTTGKGLKPKTVKDSVKNEKKAKVLNAYNALRKRYKLPSFQDLKTNFGIDKVEDFDVETLLKQLCEKVNEHLLEVEKLLVRVLQPDTDLIAMFDADVLTEQDKDKVLKTLSKLVVLEKNCLKAKLLNNESLMSDCLSQSFQFWLSEKDFVTSIIDKQVKAWKSKLEEKLDVDYLG
ncbi:hypothetical protein J7L02_02320 [Candidatus Woesearchaeota archaeon]|nr:hypothetical protein [Candidatus Woesearchaeota archaeon]